MLSLMDGLLFHVRSESGSAEFRFASIRAADLLKRAIDTAVPRHRLTDLRLNLPEAEIFCRADLPLLATALGNILANAAKYSADGTPIELALSARDEQIQITVADHGIGIPPAEIGTIFARFQRATNALSHVGAGLGLHVAQQVVEGHGGAITVRSQPGNGSCFTINLPLLRLASAAAPQLEIGTA